MDTVRLMLLAVLQGITEFLPVSSSGHLVVAEHLFGIRETALVAIILHAGTLVSILIYFWKDLLSFFFGGSPARSIALLVIASIPAAAIGVPIEMMKLDEYLFSSPAIAGFGLLGTSAVLFFLGSAGEKPGSAVKTAFTFRDAVIVGIGQALAITPGLSRSGTTISVARFLGYGSREAAAFSFIIAIPAIGGATFLKLVSLIRKGAPEDAGAGAVPLAVAFVVSAAVGYFSLRILIRTLTRRGFRIYSAYCLLAGAGILLWRLLAS